MVNQNYFIDRNSIISALRQLLLDEYPNIDRVYAQSLDGATYIAFDREVQSAFVLNKEFPSQQFHLYVAWLIQLLDKGEEQAFERLQLHHARLEKLGLLGDRLRLAALQCAELLLKNGNIRVALWAVSSYHTSPVGEIEALLHQKVLGGENVIFIEGVHAAVQWLTYHLLFQNCYEHVPFFITITREGMQNENFYIRTQAAIALSGLVQIKHLKNKLGFLLSNKVREQIHTLAFTAFVENKEHLPVLNSLTKVLRYLTDLSEEEALYIQQITDRISLDESFKDVMAFNISLALRTSTIEKPFNSAVFQARLIELLTVPGDRQRVGVWILSHSLANGHCSIDETRFLIDPLVEGSLNGESVFYFYELTKAILKSDLSYGRKCLEVLLKNEHAQPKDGYDAASYQLVELVRQVAVSDAIEASLIAGWIIERFGAGHPYGLSSLKQFLLKQAFT